MKKIPDRKPGESAPKTRSRAVTSDKAASRPSRATGIDEPTDDIRDAISHLKRERIIAEAVGLFYTQGFANTTLDAVAERMKVTKPFIYSHFKSKIALLGEICSRGIRASLDVANRVVTSKGTPTEKLHALVHDFMLAVIQNQAHIAIYTREEKHLSEEDAEAINNMRREFDRKLCDLLNQGIAAEEFIVEDVKLAALAIGGMVSWSYVWYRPDGRLTAGETAQQMTELVLSMSQVKKRRKHTRPAPIEAA